MTEFKKPLPLRITRIDHIQIGAPEGCEVAARKFYGSMLGMNEIEKPLPLRARGGCWFQCGDQQVHIGVERNFQPARKAHPAFAISGWKELRQALEVSQRPVVNDEALLGIRRFFTEDPWGNRVELIDADLVQSHQSSPEGPLGTP